MSTWVRREGKINANDKEPVGASPTMQRIFWGGGGCRIQLQRPPSKEGGNLLGVLVHRRDKVEKNGLEAARITLCASTCLPSSQARVTSVKSLSSQSTSLPRRSHSRSQQPFSCFLLNYELYKVYCSEVFCFIVLKSPLLGLGCEIT